MVSTLCKLHLCDSERGIPIGTARWTCVAHDDRHDRACGRGRPRGESGRPVLVEPWVAGPHDERTGRPNRQRPVRRSTVGAASSWSPHCVSYTCVILNGGYRSELLDGLA